MRQWLMNVSLLQGWLPATLLAITAALMVILLIGAIATIRKAGLKDSPSRIWLCGGVQVVHWP